MLGQGVLFLLWPPFARDPCHWFLEFVLLSFRACKVFFFVAPRWAPRPVGGARAKTTPRVFFSCSGPADRQGKEKRRWPPARGQSKKQDLSAGPEQKKKTSWVVLFFCSGPADRSRRPTGRNKKTKKHFARRTLTRSLWAGATLSALWAWAAMPPVGGRRGGGFFFAAAPPGHSLTHCGPGRRCLPPGPPGWCFCFFLLRPRPDAHSLTVGWGAPFGRARVFLF